MLGAIIGDIVGSRFEWNNHKSTDFELFTPECRITDDSVMSLAVAAALINCKREGAPGWAGLGYEAARSMRALGLRYPRAGYGGLFMKWILCEDMGAYNSYGNGAAMRVSACGLAARSPEEVKLLSRRVTEVTHNHPEGIKGAEATSMAVYMTRRGMSARELRKFISDNYYPLNFTLDGIRDSYEFSAACFDSVPQALEAYIESTDFESAIRNAVSIGGDSDTIAAIAGGVAEARYGIPDEIKKRAMAYIPSDLQAILADFERAYTA